MVFPYAIPTRDERCHADSIRSATRFHDVATDGAHSGNPAVRAEVAKGLPQHMAWAYERPNGGRSFGFTGGHYHWNWGRTEIITLVTNAICWTAKIDIPEQGLKVNGPTVDVLKEGQDEPIPERFNADKIKEEFKIGAIGPRQRPGWLPPPQTMRTMASRRVTRFAKLRMRCQAWTFTPSCKPRWLRRNPSYSV